MNQGWGDEDRSAKSRERYRDLGYPKTDENTESDQKDYTGKPDSDDRRDPHQEPPFRGRSNRTDYEPRGRGHRPDEPPSRGRSHRPDDDDHRDFYQEPPFRGRANRTDYDDRRDFYQEPPFRGRANRTDYKPRGRGYRPDEPPNRGRSHDNRDVRDVRDVRDRPPNTRNPQYGRNPGGRVSDRGGRRGTPNRYYSDERPPHQHVQYQNEPQPEPEPEPEYESNEPEEGIVVVFEIQPTENQEDVIDKAYDIESKYSLPFLSFSIKNNVTITVKTEADAKKLKDVWNK